MRQTAVEWLIEQWPMLESQIPEKILNEALEMEKGQIIDAWDKRGDRIVLKYFLKENITGEQYYNENFYND